MKKFTIMAAGLLAGVTMMTSLLAMDTKIQVDKTKDEWTAQAYDASFQLAANGFTKEAFERFSQAFSQLGDKRSEILKGALMAGKSHPAVIRELCRLIVLITNKKEVRELYELALKLKGTVHLQPAPDKSPATVSAKASPAAEIAIQNVAPVVVGLERASSQGVYKYRNRKKHF